MRSNVSLRTLSPNEDFHYLTKLLHQSYKIWADQGLRFLATHQSVDKTIERCNEGHTILAEISTEIIGTITINDPKNSAGVKWYEKPGVTSIHQFAVLPKFQKYGIGSLLLKSAEDYAKSIDLTELALDTSEKAKPLIDYYLRKGFRQVDTIKWETTNYVSVVLSKNLKQT